MTALDPELIAAYRATDYVVRLPDGPVNLRVDVASPELTTYLKQQEVNTAGVITADNPYSAPCTTAENRAAHTALQEHLQTLNLHVLPCDGTDPSGQWPTESGFLVLGIAQAHLHDLAMRFRQNAVLWLEADGVPRLLLLR